MNTPNTPEATNAQLSQLDQIAATAVADLTASNIGATITDPAANASVAALTDQRATFGPIPVRIDTPDPGSAAASTTDATIDPPQQRQGKNRLWALAAAVILLIAGAVVAYTVTRTDRPQGITTDPIKPPTEPFLLPDGPVQGLANPMRAPATTDSDLAGYRVRDQILVVLRMRDEQGYPQARAGISNLANGAEATVDRVGTTTYFAWHDPKSNTVVNAIWFGAPESAISNVERLSLDGTLDPSLASGEFEPLDLGTTLATAVVASTGIRTSLLPGEAQFVTLSGPMTDTDGSNASYVAIPASDAAESLRVAFTTPSVGGMTKSVTVDTFAGRRDGWLRIVSAKGEQVEDSATVPTPVDRSSDIVVALLGVPVADDLEVIVFATPLVREGQTYGEVEKAAESLARDVAKSLRPLSKSEFLAGTELPNEG